MFGQNFQRKYALTDQGVRNTKKGRENVPRHILSCR